jgi:uracil-DNA glycosylase
MDKVARLKELALVRQRSSWPSYRCIGDYHGGVYECGFISPYTRSAGNVDADLMILFQDWSSDAILSGPLCLSASLSATIPVALRTEGSRTCCSGILG